MKKNKKLFSVILAITILFSSATSFLSAVKADPNVDYPELFTKPSSIFEHNTDYTMWFYANNSTGELVDSFRVDVPKAPLVPIYTYESRTQKQQTSGTFENGMLDSRDSAFLLGLSKAHIEILVIPQTIPDDLSEATYESLTTVNQLWTENISHIKWSLVDYLKAHGRTISDSDVTLKVDVVMPVIEGYNTQKIEYSITSTTGITEAIYTKIKQAFAVNYAINKDHSDFSAQELVTLTATTSDGEEYKMVLGADNNWYLLTMKKKVIINYVTNGGKEIDPIVFTINSVDDYKLSVTLVDAEKEGSKFIGWYIDNNLTDKANINTVIDVFNLQNISTDPNVYEVNVYAKWSETTDNPKTGLTNTLYISGATIIASIGLIAIAKKKNLFKKI